MGAPKQSGHWTGFRAVLCPIDFSDHARLALRYAEVVALRAKASLTVTHANDPLLIAAAAAALHDRQLAKRSAAELQAFAEDTVAPDSRRKLRLRAHVLAASTKARRVAHMPAVIPSARHQTSQKHLKELARRLTLPELRQGCAEMS